jgi:hypothetical protein
MDGWFVLDVQGAGDTGNKDTHVEATYIMLTLGRLAVELVMWVQALIYGKKSLCRLWTGSRQMGQRACRVRASRGPHVEQS